MGRAADTQWRPLAAEVEWHAGHRGFEHPVAVRVEGKRFELTVESSSAVGPGVAGLTAHRVFLARDSSGRRLRIEVDSGGRSRVEVDAAG